MTSLSRLQITCIIILQKRFFKNVRISRNAFNRENVPPPPEFVTNLAQLISDVIYLYKVTVKVHL